jgi:hypothetical protein
MERTMIFCMERTMIQRDFLVQVIDVTDVNNPNERESFWIEKLNSYVPRGLNLREEV